MNASRPLYKISEEKPGGRKAPGLSVACFTGSPVLTSSRSSLALGGNFDRPEGQN